MSGVCEATCRHIGCKELRDGIVKSFSSLPDDITYRILMAASSYGTRQMPHLNRLPLVCKKWREILFFQGVGAYSLPPSIGLMIVYPSSSFVTCRGCSSAGRSLQFISLDYGHGSHCSLAAVGLWLLQQQVCLWCSGEELYVQHTYRAPHFRPVIRGVVSCAIQ